MILMDLTQMLVLSAAPVLFILWLVWWRDKAKEPKKMLGSIFLVSVLTPLPAIIWEKIAAVYLNSQSENGGVAFVAILVGISLIEELGKMISMSFIAAKSREYDCRYDAIVYGVFASLGFALVENFIYIFFRGFVSSGNASTALSIGIVRAIFTIPGHAVFGVLMGYFYGLAYREKHRARIASAYSLSVVSHRVKARVFLCMSLVVPILVHAIYDWLLQVQVNLGEENPISGVFLASFIMFAVALYAIGIAIIISVSRESVDFYGRAIIPDKFFNKNIPRP